MVKKEADRHVEKLSKHFKTSVLIKMFKNLISSIADYVDWFAIQV